MSDQISEQEIIKLLKKLEQDPHSNEWKGMESFSSTSENIVSDDKITDGCIKIEQGKIRVIDPTNGGIFPSITAKSPVKLMVNGIEVRKATKVSSESVIEWSVEEEPLFEVSISEDKIYAYLNIHRTKRHPWILLEKVPSLHQTLMVKEDLSIILETITLQEIIVVIENMEIKMNLDIIAIQTEIIRHSLKPTIVARGKAPIQGEDARLDIFFSESIESIFSDDSGLIDFKNHSYIPSVKSGDIIAKKTPLVEGIAGYDVFGNILPPEPVKDIRIAGKDNVEITADSYIIARKEGRPRVTGNQIKYFDINTAHIVPGDVDLQTGNIVFAGDVIVYGNVTDNMIIESLGNIYVYGSVFNSTLTATGSIAVKGNVLGSNLYSGYFGVLYNRLYTSSKQLIDIIESVIKSSKLLQTELTKKKMQLRFGHILVLIIESKYQEIEGVIKELIGVISSIHSYKNNTFEKLKDYLELFQQPAIIIEIMTPSMLEDFLRVLKEAFMRVALSQESNVHININQAQKSVLKSNGDILIRREGIIQCDLYSAGNIVFYLDNAVCRGSKLESGDTISAMIVGGITGVGTSLKAEKKVIVKQMYGGRISVDRYSMDIFEPIENKTFDSNSFKRKSK